jgi:hypothetical protein
MLEKCVFHLNTYQLNSIATSANLPQKWAKKAELTVLFK